MTEAAEARLKRMRMRAWRRGTKEMDLILGPYADARLAGMTQGDLAAFDELLEVGDQDLMAWMLGQAAAPPEHADLIASLTSFASDRLAAT